MKLFIVTSDWGRFKPSVHWTKEAAESASMINRDTHETRKVHEVTLRLGERDGSYFEALAHTTSMAHLAMELCKALTGPYGGDVFQRMAKANEINEQLQAMAKDFAK